MPLRSMTGFARADGSMGGFTWHWELRSVNGRGLELRLRLPSGFDGLEPAVREQCAKRLTRGNVSVALSTSLVGKGTSIRLNEPVLAQVLSALSRARELARDATAPSLDGLLALKGVLDVVETEEGQAEVRSREACLLTGLAEALDGLVAARAREGERLTLALLGLLEQIARTCGEARSHPLRTHERIASRLREQIERLMQASPKLDPERLHQEAILLAVKADIEEELQRLESHLAEARALLASSEPVGRKFEFLAQEFNREANTLCSKSNDAEITRLGLNLKVLIDQLREQAQNIE
jgi:uncharacterized protein (TIGR00255 family)